MLGRQRNSKKSDARAEYVLTVVVLLIKPIMFETFPTGRRSFVRFLLGSKAHAQAMRRAEKENEREEQKPVTDPGKGPLMFRPN